MHYVGGSLVFFEKVYVVVVEWESVIESGTISSRFYSRWTDENAAAVPKIHGIFLQR